MLHTQQQISQVWNDLLAGKYKAGHANSPKIIVNDEVEQVISIAVPAASGHVGYTRKPGGEWMETPTVAKTDEFGGATEV